LTRARAPSYDHEVRAACAFAVATMFAGPGCRYFIGDGPGGGGGAGVIWLHGTLNLAGGAISPAPTQIGS
jgi:hypothetical protein